MANNKHVLCSEIHSKHVNQLCHHSRAAFKLEQHLMLGNNCNGWIVVDMQLVQKILEFESDSVENTSCVTQLLFKNFRKCLTLHKTMSNLGELDFVCSAGFAQSQNCSMVKTKTMWPRAWVASTFAVVFVRGPPQTPLFCSFKKTMR